MRLASTALCAALLLAGCSVLDELDAGRKDMEARSPTAAAEKKAREEAELKAADAKAAGAAGKARRSGASAWANVKSIAADEMSEDIVRCVLGGSDQYMRKHDCLSRGGRVARRD